MYRRIDDGCLTCPAWEGGPVWATLLWPFAIASCDVYGRLPASSAVLRAHWFPYHTQDIELQNIEAAVHHWEAQGMVRTYHADGRKFLQVRNFDKHQPETVKNRKGGGKYPSPSGGDSRGLLQAFSALLQRDLCPGDERAFGDLLERYGDEKVRLVMGRAKPPIKSAAYLKTALQNEERGDSKPTPAAAPARPQQMLMPTQVPHVVSW